MQKYLNWKNQLFKSNIHSDIFFGAGIESKNLFQYKYKYYNEIAQKNIENGFFFPLVNIHNSEFYYLGKHFTVNTDLNSLLLSSSYSKYYNNDLNTLQHKNSYIKSSNYVKNIYYSLNLIKNFISPISNLYYSNYLYLINPDGSKIDFIDYGVFDFIANTFSYERNNFSNISYYSLIDYESARMPNFLYDKTVLSSSFTDFYNKFKFITFSNVLLEYLDTFVDSNINFYNDYIIDTNILSSSLLYSDISYEDINSNLDVSNSTSLSDDYLYAYLLVCINNQLKKSINLELPNQYKNTVSYIFEAIKLKKIELSHKAAEAKILDDFNSYRIGQRKKQRLLTTLYSKKKEDELKRLDAKKKEKKTRPEIHIDNFFNLDYSLDSLNNTEIGNSNTTYSISNGNIVYEYEYEALNTRISNAKPFIAVSEESSLVGNLDYLNKVNYYEVNSSVLVKKNQIKQASNISISQEEQRGAEIMNCLNNLLNYSESNNFDIEKPLYNITEFNLNKQYNFLKSLFTSYKSNNNKFPTLYVPYLRDLRTCTIMNINNSTISMYRKKNIHVQLINSSVKGLFYYPNSNLKSSKFNYYSYWDVNCLYYKFAGLLIRDGKRHKAEEILNNSFIFIKNLSLCNPLYIFMKALYNGQTFFEFTKQKKQTKSLLIPRYTPLNKRIKISMRLISNNIRNNNILRKVKKSKKYNVNTSFLLSNIFISYFFKVGKVKNDLVNNVTNAYKQKHLLKKNVSTFVYNRLLKFLAFRKIRGYHISK